MRIRHYPADSATARYIQHRDTFGICDDQGNELRTLSGTGLYRILEAFDVIGFDLESALERLSRNPHTRDLRPPRQLVNQHKPLRMKDTSPHKPWNPKKLKLLPWGAIVAPAVGLRMFWLFWLGLGS